MKNTLAIALLLAIALPSFAELTRQDVEQIIRSELEPIKKEITAIKLDIAEMRGEIKAVRAEMKTMATKDDIIAVQREVSSKFITIVAALIAFWATLLAAIITIPYLYGRADREKVKELEARLREEERRTERLQAEFDLLKSLRETAMRLAEENPEYAEGFRRLGLI